MVTRKIFTKATIHSIIGIFAAMAFSLVEFTVVYYYVYGFEDHFWGMLGIIALIILSLSLIMASFIHQERRAYKRKIREIKNAKERLQLINEGLERQASYDGLTGLPNRDFFFRQFEDMRADNRGQALLIIDADYFKLVNDNYGHQAGDVALQLMAARLIRCGGEQCLAGRIGGEEFALFIPDSSPSHANLIAEQLRESIQDIHFEPLPGVVHKLTVSIGIAMIHPSLSRSMVMRNGDLALFEAKHRGRNRVAFFEAGMTQKINLPINKDAALGRQRKFRSALPKALKQKDSA